VTAFIGNRLSVQSSAARSLFYPGKIKSFCEDLDLKSLAAEHTLEVSDALLEPPQLGGCHDVIIGAYGLAAAIAHQPPPAEHQARREPVTAGNVADRHPGLHRLGDDRQLLLGGKAPPTGDAGDHLDPGKRLGHRRSLRSVPGSSGKGRCPVETGSSSLAKTCSIGLRFKALHTPRR
jgi:hypothetical protein